MPELLTKLDNKLRTVQRYLKLLDEFGYPVDKSIARPARYFLFEPGFEGFGILHELLTTAEADLLTLRLADLGAPTPVLTNLRQAHILETLGFCFRRLSHNAKSNQPATMLHLPV